MKKKDNEEMTGITAQIFIGENRKVVKKVELTLSEKPGLQWKFASGFSPTKELKEDIENWMENYSSGRPPSLLIPLDLEGVTFFTKKVWNAVQNIPWGQTRNYQQIAGKAGSPRAFRAVGTACKRNPYLLFIPCHRVIKSNGSVCGFSQNIYIKNWLLMHEGEKICLLD